jgi:hypothetical protein
VVTDATNGTIFIRPQFIQSGGGGTPTLGFGLENESGDIVLGSDFTDIYGVNSRFIDISTLEGTEYAFGIGSSDLDGPSYIAEVYEGSETSGITCYRFIGANFFSAFCGVSVIGKGTGSEEGVFRIQVVNDAFVQTFSMVSNKSGTKIGTATNQKLAFWNKTPIVQPTTAITGAIRVGGGGTALTDTDTFDGYTLAQVVKALRDAGLLA